MKILIAIFFSFLLLFSIVPLSDANAVKAKGTSIQKYGSKTSSIVCGDKLCSDVIREGDANQQSRFAMGGVSQQGVPQLTPNLDTQQTLSAPNTMPNNPIISSSDLDEDYYNMINQPLIQYIENKNKAFTSDEYYVDESTILSSLIEQRMLQLKFDARNSGGECAAAFATNDEQQIAQKCNLPLVEIRELTGADCPDCGDITKNGKKVGFKIKTLTRITYANAEQASKMTGISVSQINWKEFKLTKDPNQDDSSFLQECQILGGVIQGNTCDATASIIKRVNDNSMSTENRKLIKADENGNPDPSDTEGLADYEEHSVRVSILETVEAKVPDEDVVATKIDSLIPKSNADTSQIIPKKTKPESKPLPDITSKSETIKKSSLDDFQDSIGRVFPVNGIPDADADVGTSKTKHFMTGFTIAPPNFNWSVEISVEGPCFGDWCFTWIDFGTGFGNYAGVGLRLPVEVTVSNIPTSLNAGQSFQIATSLTPLNFNAQQYRDFCQQENIANDSPYVYDCNAFAFARLNNPSIGDELAARAGVYFSTHLTLLEAQLWNLYKDFGIDLIKKCTTSVGVDCGDFKTPFGFTGRPISQTQNLRSFPFAAGTFMIPAMCGPGESMCTGLGIGGSVASIGLGVGIHTGLGSDRIIAHIYSNGDVAPISSDVIVDYDAVRSANEPNAPLDPVKGYMRQSITVDNYGDSKNVVMTLDDMTYYLNRAEVEGRAMLDFGGAVGNYIPDVDLFRIFKINFAQSVGSISIPQHMGTDGITLDPIPVNDYGFDISIRNSDGILLDDFDVDKRTTTTLMLYATNRGTQTDSFDNISISMKNPYTGASIPANIILTQNSINDVASGSTGTILFDIDASNVEHGRYKLVAKGDSVGAKTNNLQPTDPLGNKRINTVTNVPVDVTSMMVERDLDRRAMRPQSEAQLTSMKDSFINSASPTKNNGGNEIMKVDSKDRALVAFDRQNIINALQGKEFSGASIQLRVEKIHNQWNSYGGYVSMHKLTKDWDEGNGFNIPQEGVTLGSITTDGTGRGVTWNCVADSNIASIANDCVGHNGWNGGSFSQNQTSILIGSNYQGQQVSFDVTEDVRRILNGEAGSSWLIKLSDETVNGGVDFATKELASYYIGGGANPYYPKLRLSYFDDSQDQNNNQNTKVIKKSVQKAKLIQKK